MQFVEVEAKTVEEAIKLACKKLQTTQDNLNIEVLERAPVKIFSLFSGKKAKIRATLKKESRGAAGAGASIANQGDLQSLKVVFERIIKEIDAEATIQLQSLPDDMVFNIIGNGSGIFIGKKGRTLEALQYLLNKMRARYPGDMPHIIVDSEKYRLRHIESLVGLAHRLSEKAKKKSGPVTTPPLNAADRRVIHMTLKKDSALNTWSKGEGGMRKVIIAPRQ